MTQDSEWIYAIRYGRHIRIHKSVYKARLKRLRKARELRRLKAELEKAKEDVTRRNFFSDEPSE